MLETLLMWLLTQLLTRLSERWKVSQTYLALWLSVVLWAWYYVATTYYSVQWEQLLQWVTWVYASSQVFYNLAKKRWVLDKLDKKE